MWVITVGLEQELDRKILESHGIPWVRWAGLRAGATSRWGREKVPSLAVVLTGPGLVRAQQAAVDILRLLKPCGVLNLGTAGAFSSEKIGHWVAPRHVVDESGQNIELGQAASILDPWMGIQPGGTLLSGEKPAFDHFPHDRGDWVDQEAFSQAQVFGRAGVPLAVLKVISDKAGQQKETVIEEFSRNLPELRKALTERILDFARWIKHLN